MSGFASGRVVGCRLEQAPLWSSVTSAMASRCSLVKNGDCLARQTMDHMARLSGTRMAASRGADSSVETAHGSLTALGLLLLALAVLVPAGAAGGGAGLADLGSRRSPFPTTLGWRAAAVAARALAASFAVTPTLAARTGNSESALAEAPRELFASLAVEPAERLAPVSPKRLTAAP
eukprot:scaffold57950_cov30-Tisochrysis_lutea.AAC.1